METIAIMIILVPILIPVLSQFPRPGALRHRAAGQSDHRAGASAGRRPVVRIKFGGQGPLRRDRQEVWPFLGMLVVLAILTYVPSVSLWLPYAIK